MKQLSRREKTLAALVGAVVFVLLNLFLVSAFVKKSASLRAEFVLKRNSRDAMQQMLTERPMWEQRDQWLNKTQPKLENESEAGVQLLDQIRDMARQRNVIVENQVIGSPAKTQWYRSVSVTLETRSSWQNLVDFLQNVQRPDQCVVFESANIQIDPNNATQMHGRFKIARWYAP